jgi:hypothetical protein
MPAKNRWQGERQGFAEMGKKGQPRYSAKPRRARRIAGRAKARDGGHGGHADIALVAEFLALVRVGQVDFDHRGLDALDRIVQRDAGVGIGAGVQQHRLAPLACASCSQSTSAPS